MAAQRYRVTFARYKNPTMEVTATSAERAAEIATRWGRKSGWRETRVMRVERPGWVTVLDHFPPRQYRDTER